MGNLDFIFTCGVKLNKNELIYKSYGLLNDIVGNDNIWKSGSFNNIETYGLMTGLAGIGYQLLRFYDSSLTPSILALNQKK
jgi:lantibiotic modifying enzyme